MDKIYEERKKMRGKIEQSGKIKKNKRFYLTFPQGWGIV
jgi:hypothetical protein